MSEKMKVWGLIGILSLLCFGCGGGGDGGGTAPTPAATLSGKIAKGYVAAAQVFADKINAGATIGNQEFEPATEVGTFSNAAGDYDLTVPEGYGDYLIVSEGGTIVGTNTPAPTMMAPAGSPNVSPVTTMAALNPTFKAKLEALGTVVDKKTGKTIPKYQQDVAIDDGSADEDMVALTLAAQAVLDTFSDAGLATSGESQIEIMSELAFEFNEDLDLKTLSDPSQNTAFGGYVSEAIGKMLVNPKIVNPNSVTISADATTALAGNIAQAATSAVQAVQTNTVAGKTKESSSQAAVQTAVKKATDTVKITPGIQRVTMSVASVQAPGVTLGPAPNNFAEITRLTANSISSVSFILTAHNDFSTAKTYTNAALEVSLKDANSLRDVEAFITNVDFAVAAGNGVAGSQQAVTVTFKSTTEIDIDGHNSKGVLVMATLTNTGLVIGSTNTVTLDLNALNQVIEVQYPGSDLINIGRFSDISIGASATVIPMSAYTGRILITK